MNETDTVARLRATLHARAEHAMTVTDTDRELERLRDRLRPAGRSRRLRIVTAVAAVAALGTGIGLAATWGGDAHRTAPIGKSGLKSGHTLPPGTLPLGFPVGTFKHSGTFGLTQLTLSRRATATLVDPRDDLPTVMSMTFVTPAQVRFDITSLSGSTIRCDGITGTYTYVVEKGFLELIPVDDTCTQRRIPLSEKTWGPISVAIPPGFPTGTFQHPGTYGQTVLHLSSDGSATLAAGGGPAGELALNFKQGSVVEVTLVHPQGVAKAAKCVRPGVYRWAITGQQITFTTVDDGCGIRRIPLSEKPWGPLSNTH
jgi:hypothetical protein